MIKSFSFDGYTHRVTIPIADYMAMPIQTKQVFQSGKRCPCGVKGLIAFSLNMHQLQKITLFEGRIK